MKTQEMRDEIRNKNQMVQKLCGIVRKHEPDFDFSVFENDFIERMDKSIPDQSSDNESLSKENLELKKTIQEMQAVIDQLRQDKNKLLTEKQTSPAAADKAAADKAAADKAAADKAAADKVKDDAPAVTPEGDEQVDSTPKV